MLGGAFSDAEPWRQIAEQLGLTNAPPDAILGAFDSPPPKQLAPAH